MTIQQASQTIAETEARLKAADKLLKEIQAVCKKRESYLQKATPKEGEDLRFIRGKNKEAKQKADRSAASKLHKAQVAAANAQDIKHKAKRERIKPLHIVVEAKDRILLQGVNGCGKTSLVELLLGRLQPTEGQVVSSTQNILYFPQTALHQLLQENGHETAAEFFNSAATNLTTETEVRQRLGDVGLTKDLALSRVATLSAGQRVRLWLAQQLLHHPKPSLLILDEVSGKCGCGDASVPSGIAQDV